jgi:hypothetical protein
MIVCMDNGEKVILWYAKCWVGGVGGEIVFLR